MSQGGPVRVRERSGRSANATPTRITTRDRDNALFPMQSGPWARAVRRLRMQQLSVVLFLAASIMIPLTLAVPSLSPARIIGGAPDPGDGSGGVEGDLGGGSVEIEVEEATFLDRELLALIDVPDKYSKASETPGIPPTGLAPICSKTPGASQEKLAAAATVVLKSSTSASGVTITQSRGLFEPGGATAWLDEVSKNSCVTVEIPLPGYPEKSILFRDQEQTALAYFAAVTSDSTVLFLKVQSGSEDNALAALSGTVRNIYAEAVEDAPKVVIPAPEGAETGTDAGTEAGTGTN